MSIELNRVRGRKQVAWLNMEPDAEARRILEEREYLVARCTDDNLRDPVYLAGLTGVAFYQSPEKPIRIVRELESHARRLLDYDCRVIVRLSAGGTAIAKNAVASLKLPTVGLPAAAAGPKEGEPPLPCVRYFDIAAPWSSIANFITGSPAGPPPNAALKIVIDDRIDASGKRSKCVLRDELDLLVRRAFADCALVHLVPIEGGHSGVSVYRAYAELAGGLEGLWPQPHFIKLGDRSKVLHEYKIYEENVDPYVPFHLGPHLIRERCCLGAKDGILVGDYVDESESLRDCACTGRSATAIACLFDRTLAGWHRQARQVPQSLSAGLMGKFPFIDRASARMNRARELGAAQSLKTLKELFRRCTSQPVLVGPIHGDLHAANVRVRASDAIVIDFAAHRNLPLVFDAACLEASLLIEGFAGDHRDAQEWLKSVQDIYSAPVLDAVRAHPNPKDRSFWFITSIHQIRRYARQWECGHDQYAAALALALLIKASKDLNAPEPEASRRAGAYVLAERVLSSTFGAGGVHQASVAS
jgi:hypothetical protein